MNDLDALALALGALASAAGRVVMDVYATEFEVRAKEDASPVSAADEAAEELLVEGIARLLPGVTVVAEEATARDGLPEVRDDFVLVDPLDGTKEFVSRNGEFTVNVALISDGRPVAGCVYAPVLERLFLAGVTAHEAAVAPGGEVSALRRLRTRAYPSAGLVAVASRSHADDATAELLARLPVVETRSAGSSLKFCVVAAGEADVYPRFGPTMEWDTAAGDAVLRGAGGHVVDESGVAFRYGKVGAGFRNGPFVAWGREPLA